MTDKWDTVGVDRRSFLAAGATLAIGVTGGCTGCGKLPTARGSMEPVTDEDIAERATHSEDLTPSNSRYQFVRRMVENGSVTVEGTEPKVHEDRTVVFDGAVYRLSHEVVATEPATSYQFTLNPVDSDVSDGETIRYEDLPAVDRRKFAERGLDDPSFIGFGSTMLYTHEERPKSVLVPDPNVSVIVWDADTRGRWTVDGSYESPLKTYRYASEVVHESAAAYGAEIREEYAFALTGLSARERDIVRTAIEDGYVVAPDESPSEAFWRFAERFGSHDELHRSDEDREADDTPVSGTYLVRYEGTVYWTRVRAPARGPTTSAGG